MSLLSPEWLVATFVAGLALVMAAIAASQTRRWRRWAPATWALAAAATLATLGAANPAVLGSTGTRPLAVAVDVSPSMGAADLAPSRLDAVRQELTAWLATLPPQQQVSLVSFSGEVTQLAPLGSPAQAARGVERLALGRSTAVGEGALAAGDTLRDVGTVLLVSDGTTNVGKPGNQAAKELRQRGIVVDAIVVGTDKGVASVDGQQAAVPVDAGELKAAAAINGGSYAEARDAGALRDALARLDLARGYTSYAWVPWSLAGLALAATAALSIIAASGRSRGVKPTCS